MAVEVILPKWGLTMEEGTVSEWRKQEGDAVAEDEIIADVETDKITNELPAPASGVVGGVQETAPSLSAGFAAPTPDVERGAGNPGPPVHHACCRASLRLEGGEWSQAAEVETDADGRFRVDLPMGFTGIFAPEADAIPLLPALVLSLIHISEPTRPY